MATSGSANSGDRRYVIQGAMPIPADLGTASSTTNSSLMLRSSLAASSSPATSNEVDLGDDKEPEAIRAMIRHMYDLPYDKTIEENTADDSAAYSANEDLLFHIAVFTAADKYDVSSLRPLVVKKFEHHMETHWESESFATSIQKLTGCSAGHLADHTLQAAAAAFCARNLIKLLKNDEFVKIMQEAEPLIGRILTSLLNSESNDHIQLVTCVNMNCRNTEPSESTLQGLKHHCVVCGGNVDDNVTYVYQGRTYMANGPRNYKKARIM
ncbi:hypothetical protein KCU73_g109, partial [Aureobasidium melanogenum]